MLPFIPDKTVTCEFIEDASQWGYDEAVLVIGNGYSSEMIPMSKLARQPEWTLKHLFERIHKAEADWVIGLLKWTIGLKARIENEKDLKEVLAEVT